MTRSWFALLSMTAVVMAHSTALAATGSVTCLDKAGETAKVIEFDSRLQVVRMNGLQMIDVNITERHIKFVHDLGVAGLWRFSIDRVTGLMEQKMPGDERPGIPTHLSPMMCEKTKQKF